MRPRRPYCNYLLEAPLGALEPYCRMQSSRSVLVMPTHWLGCASPLVPLEALLGLLPEAPLLGLP